jgi:hypothetical protein
MKKENREIALLDSDISSNKDFEKDSYKTTNVNILLNRVRIEKKNNFKKKMLYSFLMITVISVISIVAISN